MFIIINEYMINIKEVNFFRYNENCKFLCVNFKNGNVFYICDVNADTYKRISKYINLGKGDL